MRQGIADELETGLLEEGVIQALDEMGVVHISPQILGLLLHGQLVGVGGVPIDADAPAAPHQAGQICRHALIVRVEPLAPLLGSIPAGALGASVSSQRLISSGTIINLCCTSSYLVG